MNIDAVFEEVAKFCQETHGSSDYYKDTEYIQGNNSGEFAPLSYLKKKVDGFSNRDDLLSKGMVIDPYQLFETEGFQAWYEEQFSRKLKRTAAKGIDILSFPDNKEIFDAVENVNKSYRVLREQQIINNGKKLPVQLGEWYAKCIFGLKQMKTSSQRGFDFFIDDKRVEVKVHWSDISSPKGVKLRKSLVELSEYSVIIYVGHNFMIREICFLDSNFIMRKFAGKGHTIFLKDSDVLTYFFSKSNKHQDKVKNSTAMMKYSNPTFAMDLAEKFSF